MSVACKICQSPDHTQFYCSQKPRPQLKATSLRRGTKKLGNGKVALLWQATRKTWLTLHKPPYTCHYCGFPLTVKTVTLDHLISRSRRPDLRYELSNLVPACWNCNKMKGSLSHDEYGHVCHNIIMKGELL